MLDISLTTSDQFMLAGYTGVFTPPTCIGSLTGSQFLMPHVGTGSTIFSFQDYKISNKLSNQHAKYMQCNQLVKFSCVLK